MNARIIVATLILWWTLPQGARAQESFSAASPPTIAPISGQDFRSTVLPITDVKFIGIGTENRFGTGFCLDPECSFIGTNYHVAAVSHLRRIKGEKVVGVYLATGPKDPDATFDDNHPMKYAHGRDLAIFELRHPLSGYHGVEFSLNELQIGQEIEIYAFPKVGISPFRSLLQFHGTFQGQTTTGLLAFAYTSSGNKSIRPGASGGIVVDSKTRKIVGILSEVARDGEAVALAVPVQELADFVRKIQPSLAQTIFPPSTGVSPVSPDLYSRLSPASHGLGLGRRPDEPIEVKALRRKAQLLADSMRNFIAVQSFAWGSGDNKDPSAVAAYEVQVLGGYQKFRKYPDGKKELQDVPSPPLNNSLTPGGEWSELPAMVGEELGLRIQQAPGTVINGRRIKVFQYRADPEDGVCKLKTILDFVLFSTDRVSNVGCYGEVWTDEDTSIVRMSEHFELLGRWKNYVSLVTYDWLRRKDDPPMLIPLTITTQAEYKKKIYWCRGQFTDYKVFSSKVKILSGSLQQ